MNITDFIARANTWFDSLSAHFANAQELARLQAEVGTHASTVADLNSRLTASVATVATLEARAVAAETALAESRTGIAAEVETVAGHRAAEIVAGLGIPPIAEAPASRSNTREELWEKYNALNKANPGAATVFYREHSAKMDEKI